MSEIDLKIAAQSEKLHWRKRLIHQRKFELQRDALNVCGKTSSLVGAFLTGSLLATLFPPVHSYRKLRNQITGSPSVARASFSTSLQLMIINSIAKWLMPAKKAAETHPNVKTSPEFVENTSRRAESPHAYN